MSNPKPDLAVEDTLRIFAAARHWQAGLVALLLGAIAALGQAPWGIWPATLLGLAGLFALLQHAPTLRRAALIGWAGGTGYFLVALSWLIEPFLVDIARHGWMAPFAVSFMAGGLALFWAIAFALSHRAGATALAFVPAFTLMEDLRGWIFTGFPWAQPGHIWVDTPLMPIAAYVGALGLTALTLALATSLLTALRQTTKLTFAVLLAVAAAYLTAPSSPPLTPLAEDRPIIRLIQPNAAQHEKWDPDMIPVFFNRQLDYTRATPSPDLIVWPETAIPTVLNHADGVLSAIDTAAGDTPVIFGAQRLEGARFFNSLVALSPTGDITDVYDKHHLVPFGEYVPFGDILGRFGIAGLAAREGNGYSSGPGPRLIDLGPLGRALPLICYEGVFPADVAAAPERADFILLITNDAWFGDISGPYQHLAQARLRSVEQGLPMIRVANTGISAMIDAEGQITASLPLGEAGYLDAVLPPALPPTIYARIGDWPLLVLLLLGFGGAWATRRHTTPLSD